MELPTGTVGVNSTWYLTNVHRWNIVLIDEYSLLCEIDGEKLEEIVPNELEESDASVHDQRYNNC